MVGRKPVCNKAVLRPPNYLIKVVDLAYQSKSASEGVIVIDADGGVTLDQSTRMVGEMSNLLNPDLQITP